MRNLLQIIIAGIFLLGTVLPGADAHARVAADQLVSHQAAQSMGHMHHVQHHAVTSGQLADCPAAMAKKSGKTSTETCCPSFCFLDLAVLQVPVFSGWGMLPPYQPSAGSLSGASDYSVERPPRR
ncbi:hypothetical protein [Roseibium sp. M-1]